MSAPADPANPGKSGAAGTEEAELRARQCGRPGGDEYVRGKLLMARGRFAEMAPLFAAAVALGNVSAMNDLAFYHHQVTKQPKEADALYQKAADAGSAQAAFNLGHLRSEQGDSARALAAFARAAELGHADADWCMAVTHEAAGALDKAEPHFKAAAARGNAKAACALGDCLLARGKTAEAKAQYRAALAAGHQLAHAHLTSNAAEIGLTAAERADADAAFDRLLFGGGGDHIHIMVGAPVRT